VRNVNVLGYRFASILAKAAQESSEEAAAWRVGACWLDRHNSLAERWAGNEIIDRRILPRHPGLYR
jgi:hypothetical protein